MIETVTSSTFSEMVLEAPGRIAVEFMSYGCSHCRVLEPFIQALAKSLRGSVTIFRVNVALEQELAASYRVEGTPTLIMFFDGVEVGRVEGPQPAANSLLAALTDPFRK